TNHEFEPRRPGRSDELDDLLRKADWPAPPPAALERLERRWRQISSAAKRSQRPWLLVAVAASVVAVAVGLPLLRQPPARKPAAVVGGQPQTPVPGETRTTQDGEKTDRRSPEVIVLPEGDKPPLKSAPPSSPSNASEPKSGTGETKSRGPRKTPRPRTQRQWIAHFRRLDRQLLDAIHRTADDGEIVTAEVAEMPPSDRAYCVQRLPTMIVSSNGERQAAAIELLEEVAGDAAVPIMIQLAEVPNCREEIVRRLASRVDTAVLQSWITTETSSVLQRSMLTSLIRRADEYSVAAFLSLVASRRTRRPALDALRETPDPPSQVLLGFFRNPDQDLRTAAVLALAETNDEGVVDPLIEMVTSNYHRLEALMALMGRDDPRSARFVYQVAHHKAFAGAVLSARNGLRQLVN
ncbi:MAG: HEAT repeat domain-containing protein, partial [Pirellulaceae bacterium]